MFILFIFILAAGIGAFLFVFMKEFKDAGVAVPVTAEGPRGAVSQEQMELKMVNEASVLKLMTLEKLIEEKNHAITQLQKNAFSQEDHQDQVEKLKQIFQGQIDLLKQENKSLKDELSRSHEENMSLQARMFAKESQKPLDPPDNVAPEKATLLQDVFSPDNGNRNYY